MATKIRQSFKIGALVRLTPDAVEHYHELLNNPHITREVLANERFKVTSASKFYCPSKTHFSDTHDRRTCTGHPGYDAATGDALYDIEPVADRWPWGWSLYDYELMRA